MSANLILAWCSENRYRSQSPAYPDLGSSLISPDSIENDIRYFNWLAAGISQFYPLIADHFFSSKLFSGLAQL